MVTGIEYHVGLILYSSTPYLRAGRTALHAAALLSQADLVALLLAFGAAEVPDDQDMKQKAAQTRPVMPPLG